MKDNIPQSKNVSKIESFQLFNIKEVALDKYHICLDILQSHAFNLAQGINNKYDIDREAKEIFISNLIEGISKHNLAVMLIKSIISNEKRLQSINNSWKQNAQNKANRILNKYQLINLDNIQNDVNNLNKAIQRIRIKLSEHERDIIPTYHAKLYEKLAKEKDKFDSEAITIIVGIILGEAKPNPITIKNMLQSYEQFLYNLSVFNGEKLSEEQTLSFGLKIKEITVQIDPSVNENPTISNKYSYLLPFCFWSILATEMSLNVCNLKKAMRKLRIETDKRKKYAKKLSEIKARTTESIDSSAGFAEIPKTILKTFEEIIDVNNLKVKEYSKILDENITVYFSSLPDELEEEKVFIQNLYLFLKGLKYPRNTVVDIDMHQNENKKSSKYFCGLLNCLSNPKNN